MQNTYKIIKIINNVHILTEQYSPSSYLVYATELSTGHFSWTRPDPTRRNVDPTRPDPTRPAIADE